MNENFTNITLHGCKTVLTAGNKNLFFGKQEPQLPLFAAEQENVEKFDSNSFITFPESGLKITLHIPGKTTVKRK